MIFLQPHDLQECTASHFKDLIHIYLEPEAVEQLLTGFMLGQSTPISYHTEANGCIFFAAGVGLLRALDSMN